MPRYVFHIENGHRLSGDGGDEFPCDEAALKAAQAIVKDFSKNKKAGGQLRVVVTDETGCEVADVPLPWKIA